MKNAEKVNCAIFTKLAILWIEMFTPTMEQEDASARTRRQAADEINHVMTRFPMILEILGELRAAKVPLPGDSDILHGCERALTSMLGALTRIEPAQGGRRSKSEETALTWLSTNEAPVLIDADQLQRLHQIIESILGIDSEHN